MRPATKKMLLWFSWWMFLLFIYFSAADHFICIWLRNRGNKANTRTQDVLCQGNWIKVVRQRRSCAPVMVARPFSVTSNKHSNRCPLLETFTSDKQVKCTSAANYIRRESLYFFFFFFAKGARLTNECQPWRETWQPSNK